MIADGGQYKVRNGWVGHNIQVGFGLIILSSKTPKNKDSSRICGCSNGGLSSVGVGGICKSEFRGPLLWETRSFVLMVYDFGSFGNRMSRENLIEEHI